MMLLLIDEKLDAYCNDHTTAPSPALTDLVAFTRANVPESQMQVGRVEGQLLALLVALSGAKRVLEIGTYTGYSALAMAEALPADGRLLTLDVDPVNTAIARKTFDSSPHGAKIEIKLGPARDTLGALPLEPTFDLVFLDADKASYVDYFELCLPRMREGALLAADNTLWSGKVLDPRDADSRGIARFNDHVQNDPRVTNVLLSIRDGLMLARKTCS
jgi:caffeoyl-CoA O-methyltransferase